MTRRLFDAIGKTWLVICVFIAATWGLSYFVGFGWRFFSQDTQHSWTSDLETVRGGIQFREEFGHRIGSWYRTGQVMGQRPRICRELQRLTGSICSIA